MEELINSLEQIIKILEELKRNIPHSFMFSYSYYSIIENNLHFTIDNLSEQLTNVKEMRSSIDSLKALQKPNATDSKYHLGLYNGMELISAMVDQREPEYLHIQFGSRKG